ncbi:hypothetical protein Nham_2146 [Nitrobacter hamburgensis X14]|uniref:Uncharacterized protein n=1 Tax=Nitrobacter hamburgensis (strain DSM 10229 / NCIMB 13809 / X14) TaxID=323097 RepID=Q1QLF5_NITHX|nr:hypothetical protein Nham_2146 [Nitrobacter hamburgensis X14]
MPASTPMLPPMRMQLDDPSTLTKPGPNSEQDFCADSPDFLTGCSVLMSRSEMCEPRVCAHADVPAKDSTTTSTPYNDRRIMSDAPSEMATQPAPATSASPFRSKRDPAPLRHPSGRMLAPPGKRHYTFRRCRRSGSPPPGDTV